MSAIWGYINLNSAHRDLTSRIKEVSALMREPYKECAIDRFEERSFDNGFFACGIQYFNKRSRNENFPFYNRDDEIAFTADVVLHDRIRLVDELNEGVFLGVSLETPDGELAFRAWKKWGCEFTKHIYGLFAIAIYEKKKNNFYLFTDHTGCRCADYSVCGDELFFSTLSRPVLNAMPADYKGFDEQFITGCEASFTAYLYVFPDRTPFRNVYHTVRGCFIEARAEEDKFICSSKTYYDPGKIRVSKRKWPKNPYDPVYREAFRKVFFDCVKDAVDTDGEVAATISSGLDSSSVATVAARFLQNEDRKLFGFTSVPLKKFEYKNPGLDMPDESNGVRNIVAGYPNIVQEFCDCDGMSSLTEMDELAHMSEVPGKAFVNQVWITHIAKTAAKKGCKVLLNGQYGNFTISRGDMKQYFFQLVLSGRIPEAKKQLGLFGKKNGVPRKILFKGVMDEIKEELELRAGSDRYINDILDKRFLEQSLIHKHKIKKVLKKRFSYYGITNVGSVRTMYRNLGDINILQTQGLYDTLFSLYYGILFSDPTKDIRLMEFCASLPPEQYVFRGMERRLVREYLDDFLPDYERLQVKYKGRQSADKVTRLKSFGDTRDKMTLNPGIYDYMRKEEVAALMKEEISEENSLDVVRIIALSKFFDEFGNTVEKEG